MNLPARSIILISWILLWLAPGLLAEVPPDLEDAMVRIYNCMLDPAGARGSFLIEKGAAYGTGTGFVINDQGYIVTNEHVTRAKEAGSVYWAAHKEGGKIVFYSGALVWSSPNQDLAIIQCPDLKTRTLPLSLFKPGKGAIAHSLGYPGIADADTLGNSGKLFHDIGTMVQQNPGVAKLDITKTVGGNKTWQNLYEATLTTGTIEKESVNPGFAENLSARSEVAVWDHTLAIRHGNSGGPFLNACGQVIGIVGRGFSKGKSAADIDRISWAIQVSEIIPILESKNIAFTKITAPCVAAKPLGDSSSRMVPVIVASVLAAVGASLLVAFKTNKGRQAAVSYTRVIEAKFKELMGGPKGKGGVAEQSRSVASPRHPAPPNAAPSPSTGATLLLQGKMPDGRDIRLELSDALFARNGNRLVIGRSRDLCHLHLDDSSVSRQHAQIRRSEQTFFVADRNSANGTSINGRRLSQPLHEEPVRENDTVTFGEVKLVLRRA